MEDAIALRVMQRVSIGYVPLRDYALEAGGAKVIPQFTTPDHVSRGIFRSWYSPSAKVKKHPPNIALTEDLGHGSCWRFEGKSGYLGIALIEPVYITRLTIDHISRTTTSDIALAPRRMVLWGLVEGKEEYDSLRHLRREDSPVNSSFITSAAPLPSHQGWIPLSSFTYDIHADFHIQTFSVWDRPQELGIEFGVVVLEVLDNWGANATCLYRVRVHGDGR
ncbi:hypothetical protein DENSPDRAFT_788369 [Dentipellis sp. KUC8613]|nr:hypothetical protein DENSPDRAFT_788369 [Dentipellis sp. KUC8613]